LRGAALPSLTHRALVSLVRAGLESLGVVERRIQLLSPPSAGRRRNDCAGRLSPAFRYQICSLLFGPAIRCAGQKSCAV